MFKCCMMGGKMVRVRVEAYNIAVSRPSQIGQLLRAFQSRTHIEGDSEGNWLVRVQYVICASCVRNVVSRRSHMCVLVRSEKPIRYTDAENTLHLLTCIPLHHGWDKIRRKNPFLSRPVIAILVHELLPPPSPSATSRSTAEDRR
jgi:hypothetical protein